MSKNNTVFNLPLVISMFCLAMALIEVLFFLFILYADYVGADIGNLLQINFYSMFFIIMGILFISITRFIISVMNISKTYDNDNFNEKW
jgi:uncharacterized Tic20 family protein